MPSYKGTLSICRISQQIRHLKKKVIIMAASRSTAMEDGEDNNFRKQIEKL